MARYTGRQSPGISNSSSANGGFLGLGAQLAARRNLNRPAPKKVTSVKPSLTTSKQKEAEISKLISKDYLPSGMQLAKLRQLAAQGKILNPKEARDFLHRSEAGEKIDTREGLQKFETELLKAELQATKDAVNSPIKYKFRESGEARINQKAKELVKGLYKESAEQAHQHTTESAKTNALQDRQARLATLHAAIRPSTPTATPTPALRSSITPTLQTIEPLSVPTQNPARSSSVVPLSGGSHLPNIHQATGEPSVNLGMPVVAHRETSAPGTQVSEPVTPSLPTFQEPEPLNQTLPSHPAVPTETAPVSDAFGGSGVEE